MALQQINKYVLGILCSTTYNKQQQHTINKHVLFVDEDDEGSPLYINSSKAGLLVFDLPLARCRGPSALGPCSCDKKAGSFAGGGNEHTSACSSLTRMPKAAVLLWRELRGSQGTGVVSNNWLDRVLRSVPYMFKPSCRPIFKPPSLGPL